MGATVVTGWLVKLADVNEFYAERGGGVRTYVEAKLKAAADLGHEVVVIAPGPEDREEAREGGKIVWVKGPPLPVDPRYYILYREAAVHRALEREQPDIVEGSSPWSGGWFAARSSGRAKKVLIYHQDPVAVYPHTFFDRWASPQTIDGVCAPYWSYVRSLASRFDSTVVSGGWLAERLSSFGLRNVAAVPFGISRSEFSPDLADTELRMELLQKAGAPKDGHLFLTISRHHPEKRLGALLRAFDRFQRTHPAGLVVFGDGPMRGQVRRLARRCAGVHIAGFVSDREYIAKALASADGLFHGSAAETYGFVIAEAMSSGTGIVAPERGGAFDLVEPSCAELYTPGDIAGAVRALERYVSRDQHSVSRAAAALAERTVWTQRQHFEGLFEHYARLIHKPAAH